MPKSCSAPRCQTGNHNDHSGIPVFQMPYNSPDIEQKWKKFLHIDDKLQLYKLPFVDINCRMPNCTTAVQTASDLF